MDEGKKELLVGPDPQVHASAPHQVLGTVPLLKLKVVPVRETERIEGLKMSFRRSRLSNPGLEKLAVTCSFLSVAAGSGRSVWTWSRSHTQS